MSARRTMTAGPRLSLHLPRAGRSFDRGEPAQELDHCCADFLAVRLEREVARVEQPHFSGWIIPRKGMRSGREKKRIMLPPDGKCRWPMFPKIFLNAWIELHIVPIVEKQIQLNVLVARACQQGAVEGIGLRRNARLVRALRVLPFAGVWRQERSQRVPMLSRRMRPVPLNRIPVRAETFLVRIPILSHDGRNPIGM